VPVPLQLLTVGHGNLDQEAFRALVTGAGVRHLVDVRRFPGSRRHPHFGSDAMRGWLAEAGVDYRWEERLGGRRRPDPAQVDADPWWRVDQFRAYAAHTRTPEFAAALDDVLELAGGGTTAVMCSESLWWRCHRRLVSDVAVLLHGVEVLHLAHSGATSPHRPAAGARIADDGLRYDVTTNG
jgi:uncharacterized protein (DUF488 family)